MGYYGMQFAAIDFGLMERNIFIYIYIKPLKNMNIKSLMDNL